MTASVILTIREGARAGERHEFKSDGEYSIGRGEDCAVNLSGVPECLTVSRRHCVVQFNPPCVRVRDLGSRNGTYVNGTRIGPTENSALMPNFSDEPCQSHDLEDGDEIRVGPIVFDVKLCDDEAEVQE